MFSLSFCLCFFFFFFRPHGEGASVCTLCHTTAFSLFFFSLLAIFFSCHRCCAAEEKTCAVIVSPCPLCALYPPSRFCSCVFRRSAEKGTSRREDRSCRRALAVRRPSRLPCRPFAPFTLAHEAPLLIMQFLFLLLSLLSGVLFVLDFLLLRRAAAAAPAYHGGGFSISFAARRRFAIARDLWMKRAPDDDGPSSSFSAAHPAFDFEAHTRLAFEWRG